MAPRITNVARAPSTTYSTYTTPRSESRTLKSRVHMNFLNRTHLLSRSSHLEQLHGRWVEHHQEESRQDKQPRRKQHPNLRPLPRLHQFQSPSFAEGLGLGPKGLDHGGAVGGRRPESRGQGFGIRKP